MSTFRIGTQLTNSRDRYSAAMSVTSLTASSQTYLKAIWNLQEWSDDPVGTSMLAAKVGVRLSTVSEAVRKLTEQGMLQHTRYGSVALTEEGAQHAVAMVRRHRLIETFLAETLGYRWDQVHEEAEALEHVVSDFMVDRIDELLGYPTKDPHGDPIPSRAGDIEHPDGAGWSCASRGWLTVTLVSCSSWLNAASALVPGWSRARVPLTPIRSRLPWPIGPYRWAVQRPTPSG